MPCPIRRTGHIRRSKCVLCRCMVASFWEIPIPGHTAATVIMDDTDDGRCRVPRVVQGALAGDVQQLHVRSAHALGPDHPAHLLQAACVVEPRQPLRLHPHGLNHSARRSLAVAGQGGGACIAPSDLLLAVLLSVPLDCLPVGQMQLLTRKVMITCAPVLLQVSMDGGLWKANTRRSMRRIACHVTETHSTGGHQTRCTTPGGEHTQGVLGRTHSAGITRAAEGQVEHHHR